jgi:pimeloyl-ACP methyl ester carboxylesterase
VNGLAILDIGVNKTEGKHEDILQALISIHPEEFSSRELIQAELEKFVPTPQVRQFLLKNILRKVDNSFAWKFNRDVLVETYPLLTSPLDLKEIYMGPTLFLRGENSGYLKEELDLDVLRFFPLAILQTIENAGHWLHAEQPDAIFEILQNFFG